MLKHTDTSGKKSPMGAVMCVRAHNTKTHGSGNFKVIKFKLQSLIF